MSSKHGADLRELSAVEFVVTDYDFGAEQRIAMRGIDRNGQKRYASLLTTFGNTDDLKNLHQALGEYLDGD